MDQTHCIHKWLLIHSVHHICLSKIINPLLQLHTESYFQSLNVYVCVFILENFLAYMQVNKHLTFQFTSVERLATNYLWSWSGIRFVSNHWFRPFDRLIHGEPGKIHLVLEYCRGGDLSMFIQRRQGRIPKATSVHFMQQLASKHCCNNNRDGSIIN